MASSYPLSPVTSSGAFSNGTSFSPRASVAAYVPFGVCTKVTPRVALRAD